MVMIFSYKFLWEASNYLTSSEPPRGLGLGSCSGGWNGPASLFCQLLPGGMLPSAISCGLGLIWVFRVSGRWAFKGWHTVIAMVTHLFVSFVFSLKRFRSGWIPLPRAVHIKDIENCLDPTVCSTNCYCFQGF